MGALVVELGAAFVLLVAGGCARAVAQPLWRRFVHWWHTEGNEPAEFKFMDRLFMSMAVKSPVDQRELAARALLNDEAKNGTTAAGKGAVEYLEQIGAREVWGTPMSYWKEKYAGTKNAGRMALGPVLEAQEELLGEDDEVWMKIAMQSGASLSEAQERVERFHAMRKKS